MTNSLRIALAQFTPEAGGVNSNVTQMLGFLEEAASQQATMVCLPELCLPGYLLDGSKYTDGLLSELSRAETSLKVACSELKLRIIYGTARSWGGSLYNCVVAAGPDQASTVYVKSHMVEAERVVFTPGDNLVTTADGDFGLGCCYDLAFPEFSAHLARSGARVLCFPMAWEKERAFVYEGIVAARAIENIAYVICVNQTGALGNAQFYGGSRILDPLGRTICQMGDEVGLVVSEIDLDNVTRLRNSIDNRTYPLFVDRRSEMPIKRGVTLEQLFAKDGETS